MQTGNSSSYAMLTMKETKEGGRVRERKKHMSGIICINSTYMLENAEKNYRKNKCESTAV